MTLRMRGGECSSCWATSSTLRAWQLAITDYEQSESSARGSECCHALFVEQNHHDLLLRVYQAETSWSAGGGEPRTFMLVHGGGMQSDVDHPGWDPSWPAPSELTIDDLGELGFLRVQPSHNKQRTFTLSMAGRELASRLHRRAPDS